MDEKIECIQIWLYTVIWKYTVIDNKVQVIYTQTQILQCIINNLMI